MATVKLPPLITKKFLGLNLDVSEEKLLPGAFIILNNMKPDIDGNLKRVNGCTLQKDVSGVSDAIRTGVFPTRGEKYIFIYHVDKKVRIYTWPDFTEITYSTVYTDINDIALTEEPWFAVHNGEMYFGNMADGIWRWKPGHQPLMRGSVPNDIIVQLGEEEGEEKDYTEWEFAYDYEKNGGRSPLSRKARAMLYNNKLTVKVIIDTPPIGSRGRRIYASPDNGTTWYYVKEVTNNSDTYTVLDTELIDYITDERKYSEANMANTMSPCARFGISFLGRLYVGYTKNSPSEILYSEIGKPYFNYTNAFDLKEPITNLIVFGNVVASSLNKISICSDEPKRMDPITVGMGAFEGSMAVVNNKLYFANEYGMLEYSSKGLKRVGTDEYLSADELIKKEGVSTANFTGLKKPKRIILITDQGDYEWGEYHEGISSDVFPGALTLKQNVVTGIAGILDEHTTYSSDFGKLEEGSYCISFQIPGSTIDTVTVEAISLLIEKFDNGGDPGELIGTLRKDDSSNPGYPDTSEDGLLSEFSGDTMGGQVYFEKFKLTEKSTINRGTTYWLVIPKQGAQNSGWRLYGNDWDRPPMYMRGRAWWSDGGGTNWVKHDHIQDFGFKIHGKSTNILADRNTGWELGLVLESKTYTRAFKLEVEVDEIELDLLEIFVDKEGSPAAVSTAAIHQDDNGEPGTKVYDIPTFTELSDPNAGEGSWTENAFTLQSEFSAGKTLSKGTYWIVLPEIGTGTSNYYKWFQEGSSDDGSLESDDGGSTWSAESSGKNIWFKLWATASYEYFASSGYWISPKFTIGANDDFDKVYWSRMIPSGASAKLYIDEDESGSWTEITSSTPYSVTGDVTIIQFKVELSLGTANFTPVVDSILTTFTKENDEGDILKAGNVNGDFYLSRIDDDGDSSEEFTYVLSKMNTIYALSEPFYDFLPIAEKTTLGIGKNTNGDLNIYKLDEGDKWYKNDTGYEKDIATEIETGKMLYDSLLKFYRKMFLHAKSSSDTDLYIELITGGGEADLEDDITEVFSSRISIDKISSIKPIPFSLPDRMEGNWAKLRITSDSGEWSLHGFEIYPYGKTGRLIGTAGDIMSGVILKLMSTTTSTNAQTSCFSKNCLFVGSDYGSGANAYIRKYKVEKNGTLTFLKSVAVPRVDASVNITQLCATDDYLYVACSGNTFAIYNHDLTLLDSHKFTGSQAQIRFAISNDENYAWVNIAIEEKLYCLDISNKSSISSVGSMTTASSATDVVRYESYLYIAWGSDPYYLKVYDISDPETLPYDLLKTVVTKNITRMKIAEDVKKIFYAGGSSTNGPGIIDISTPANPSVIINDDGGSLFGREIARKDKYLFVLDANNDKVMTLNMGLDYDSLDLESTLSTTIGDYNNASAISIDTEWDLAFDGINLLAYCSIASDVIYVFKMYGV